MKLEKAIKYLDMIKNEHNLDLLGYVYKNEAIETLIKYIKEESIPRAVVEEKINKYDEKIAKMEKDDIGIGFTLGKEWSDLKAKREVLQEILNKGEK